jgi:hypothetical protein
MVRTYETNQFTIDPVAKTMTAELSSLVRNTGFVFDPLAEVNPLSGERSYGIAILSNKTNKVAEFKVTEQHREEATEEIGDITHWTLRPTIGSMTINPGLSGWTVVIFND